jgi:uncharacterized protein (TIGR03086 family)
MAGWAHVFAAAANGERFDGDPAAYQAGPGSADDFEAAADRIVGGWRAGGFDRSVPMTGGEQPASMVANMTLMEYVTHGWDLAVATGQPVPYFDEEAAETLWRAEKTLPPQYRGPGKPFGDIVEISATAPATDRLAAFMGRRPAAATEG